MNAKALQVNTQLEIVKAVTRYLGRSPTQTKCPTISYWILRNVSARHRKPCPHSCTSGCYAGSCFWITRFCQVSEPA